MAVEPSSDSAVIDLLAEREEVIAALGGLSPHQRAVLVLRYFYDMSDTQVARTLGCTAGPVRGTASRSLAQLRNDLAPAAQREGSTNG